MRCGTAQLNAGEQALLRTVIRSLETVVLDPDPKVEVILHYLRNRDWLRSHGAILFSQYFTTAEWIALRLADVFPPSRVFVYTVYTRVMRRCLSRPRIHCFSREKMVGEAGFEPATLCSSA